MAECISLYSSEFSAQIREIGIKSKNRKSGDQSLSCEGYLSDLSAWHSPTQFTWGVIPAPCRLTRFREAVEERRMRFLAAVWQLAISFPRCARVLMATATASKRTAFRR